MKFITMSRRRALVAAVTGGLGAFVPSVFAQQNANQPQSSNEPDYGAIHKEWVTALVA
jgi:hypothetical protein